MYYVYIYIYISLADSVKHRLDVTQVDESRSLIKLFTPLTFGSRSVCQTANTTPPTLCEPICNNLIEPRRLCTDRSKIILYI